MRTTIAISYFTLLSLIRDRVFYASLIFSVFLVLFSFFLSSLSIIESGKVLLDFGFGAISISSVFLSLYLGTSIIRSEIEKRTIYSVLSKPINRSSYLIGKFLGAGVASVASTIVMSITLIGIILQTGNVVPNGFWAAIYLVILESLTVLSFSFLMSVWASSLVLASSLSIAFFLIGRSASGVEHLLQNSIDTKELLIFNFLKLIVPNFERFNIRDLVAYSKPFDPELISHAALFFLCYLFFLISFQIYIFSNKDLN